MVIALHVWLHGRIVRLPHPATQDEPGFVEITAAKNPYQLAGVVTTASVYGPAYAWWARPFAAVFADPYRAHRVANTVALLALLGMLGWMLRRERVDQLGTVVGLSFVYALLAGSHSLAVGADLLAAALYFAALAVGKDRRWLPTVAAIILCALAGLAKPYVLLAWGIIATHRMLFAPLRHAAAFLALSAAAALGLGALLHVCAPYYWLTTFELHRLSVASDPEVFVRQNLAFLGLAGALVALVLLQRPVRRRVRLVWGAPLLEPAAEYWTWATVVAAAALWTTLSWHGGNFLVYHHHLLLAPLTISALHRLPHWPRLGPALLAANLIVVAWQMPPGPGDDNWSELATVVSATPGRILAEPLLLPFAAQRPDLEWFEHGQTATVLAFLDESPAVAAAQSKLFRALDADATALTARIAAEEFDAIFLAYEQLPGGTTWCYRRGRFLKTIFAHYVLVKTVPVFPYFAPYWDRSHYGQQSIYLTKWVPKHAPGVRD